MTAAASTDDDPTVVIYRTAVRDYLTRNRHAFPTEILARKAEEAGIAALRNSWERHPGDGEIDLTGHVVTAIAAEKDALKAQGWTCLGKSSIYLLAPPAAAAADGAT